MINGRAASRRSSRAGGDFKHFLNPNSLDVATAKCEPNLKDARLDLRYQFERLGYFCLDPDAQSSTADPQLIFNRTITLRDTWAKESQRG